MKDILRVDSQEEATILLIIVRPKLIISLITITRLLVILPIVSIEIDKTPIISPLIQISNHLETKNQDNNITEIEVNIQETICIHQI